MVELVFVLLVIGAVVGAPVWTILKIFDVDEYIMNWLAARKRAAFDAYIDSEVERRKALRAEMIRLGYNREDAMPEDLDKLRALFKEEFPDLYKDKV